MDTNPLPSVKFRCNSTTLTVELDLSILPNANVMFESLSPHEITL